MTASCPPNALSIIKSSAPFEEMRVRNSAGGWPGSNEATPGKLSTIFHPFTGCPVAGGSKGGSLRSLARRIALNSSTVYARGSNSLCTAIWMLPSEADIAICRPGLRSNLNDPRARALAETGSETASNCNDERRMNTRPPLSTAASLRPSPSRSPKAIVDAGAFNRRLPAGISPLQGPAVNNHGGTPGAGHSHDQIRERLSSAKIAGGQGSDIAGQSDGLRVSKPALAVPGQHIQ